MVFKRECLYYNDDNSSSNDDDDDECDEVTCLGSVDLLGADLKTKHSNGWIDEWREQAITQ